jgi:biopolymer transport protein ExbD
MIGPRLGLVASAIIIMAVSSALGVPVVVRVRVQQDGSVYLGETRYSDDTKLQTALAALAKEKPAPEFHVTADKTVRFESIGKVFMLMQRAGIAGKIGFITAPRN